MLERTRAAILFPGQGAEVTDFKPIVEEHCRGLHSHAGEMLGADPLEHADLSTRFAQPAVFLASLAGWRALTYAGIEPYAFAGHSLGEIAALTAAGALEAEDALRLVVLRGRLMDEIATTAHGGMLAVLKGSVEQAERLALGHGLRVANYNAPGQTVLSGALGGLDAAARDARAQGLRALHLSVAGAFHTPALRPARVRFQQALTSTTMKAPSAPVISSMTAAPFTDPVNQLGAALINPVRWSETMATLEQLGAPGYVDVGPDHVLERLVPHNLVGAKVIDRANLGVHA
jgi:[acyl-carrier-protein] S-malonyltransferase